MLQPLRNALRTLGRPLARAVRQALETPTPLTSIQPVKIERGPAKGCEILLPVPSELAVNIAAGEYETSSIRLIEALVRPNDICYDIGGHYGYYSLVLATLAKQGHVHCFEPVAELAERIGRSITASKLPNASVHATAMAGEVGQMQFRFAGSQSLDDSMGYLARYGGVNTPRSQAQYGEFAERSIPTTTLDRLELPDPSFIKIDAEGAEAEILQAGLVRMARAKPRMLIELHGVDLALKVANILGPMGYRAFAAGARSLMMPVLWIHESDARAIESIMNLPGDPVPQLFASDQ